MSFRSPKNLLFIIVCLALAFRVITVLALNIQPESDYAGYQAMAQNFLAGNGLTDGVNKAFLSAGYSIFVLVPVFAVFGNILLMAQLANAVLGAISTLLCYFVARRAGTDRTGGIIASTLFALYLPSWLYAEYLAKENLMTPLMLGVAWCALKISRENSYPVALLCGLLFGLLAVTGNSALAIACTVLLALIFCKDVKVQKFSTIVIIALVAGLTVSPLLIRNQREIGAPVVNSNSGFNFYIGNNPSATGYFISVSDTPIGGEWHKILEENGELGASKILGKLAIEWIKEHPSEALVLSIKKAGLFWLPPTHSGKSESSKFESIARSIWLVQFIILVIASLGGLAFRRLRNRHAAILWSAVLGYTAVHMFFYVNFRYREPIIPFLCVLSACTLAEIFREIFHRKNTSIDEFSIRYPRRIVSKDKV